MRRQALPLWKVAGEVQENPATARVGGVEDADCQRGSERKSLPQAVSCRAWRRGVDERSEITQRGHPGMTAGNSQGAALAVGVRPQRGDAPTR